MRNRSSGLEFFSLVVGLSCLVASTAWTASRDEDIRAAIEHSIGQLPKMNRADVRVDVESGNVILHGRVTLYAHKMHYERIAWTTDGVREVETEILVVPYAPIPDSDIENSIRTMVNVDERYHGAELRFTVDNGAVAVAGTLDHPNDVLFLKHRLAEIDGVTAIVIDSAFRV